MNCLEHIEHTSTAVDRVDSCLRSAANRSPCRFCREMSGSAKKTLTVEPHGDESIEPKSRTSRASLTPLCQFNSPIQFSGLLSAFKALEVTASEKKEEMWTQMVRYLHPFE
jgi:hypothetical protein